MYKFTCDDLSLDKIADSGQTFRFVKIDDGSIPAYSHYLIPAFGRCLDIEQDSISFIAHCSEKEWNSIWKEYFDLTTDYHVIEKLIRDSKDSYLIECYEYGKGIRILKQDLWEMLISFVISQNNNIKRIAGSIEKLCNAYGPESLFSVKNEASLAKNIPKAFPSVFEVPDEAWDDTTLGLGYRNEYLRGIFAMIKENPYLLETLKSMDYENAYKELLSVKGIGSKVANCICLFGLHHVAAFPVDTHIKQILNAHYPNGFDLEYYEGVAGIVQQYMFYHKLKSGNK